MATSESSEEEGDFSDQLRGGGIQPYLFEPEFGAEELQSRWTVADSSEAEDEGNEEGRVADDLCRTLCRLGNRHWCSCTACEPMPTARESLCCLEMEILADKRADTGNL